MEEVYKKQDNLNDWMEHVKLSGDLPDQKGKVVAIKQPELKETKFGNRKACEVVIEGKDGSMVSVRLFLPQQFPMVHPKSNIAKILRYYGCTGLKELIGKEVEVISVGDMLWKIQAE